jgi:hypothetical protein
MAAAAEEEKSSSPQTNGIQLSIERTTMNSFEMAADNLLCVSNQVWIADQPKLTHTYKSLATTARKRSDALLELN